MLGAILAGGRAQRFGSDKAHALYQGRRLIDHVAESLGAQCGAVTVCGREELGFDCLADRPEAELGPLGGLNAALHHAQSRGFDHVLSAGVDVPNLPNNLVEALAGEGAAIAQSQPVVGLWPVSLSGALEAFLAKGGRALYGFADHVSARQITLAPPLLNVNRPDDLPG
ncbi:molybdenum cofactor guanylyltransferase [Erythrobacter sp. KMU-140]|uniref:Molybdenum cofactor guanylyltransferase n=1 Tax=Erythrobacter rubeus TaxID=2760803 RepID=A0ABR8KXZ1_9SPHN|nr:molybdenum cofactor guanylyltransferase [Erythrobacter rubeus]